MTRTEKLLSELIALPSVNPAFLPGGDPFSGEQKVAEFLAATAAQAGLTVEFQRVSPGRSNLLARLTPAGKLRSRVLLAPHLDTVVADKRQFVPRITKGRMYGRGACDTKGSVAAMFIALCELARGKRRPRKTEIIFAGLVDEENGQAGARALVAGGLRGDLAIVGEPTRLRVVTAHKGSLWLRLETRGKSAHAARPELGSNAVYAMAKIVDLFQGEYAEKLCQRQHPLLGSPTVNVGTISGGTQVNIVPDYCQVLVDRRTLPGETEVGVKREVRTLLRNKHLKATLATDQPAPCLPLETKPGLPLVAQFLSCVGQSRPAGADYFCDASVLAQGGIPSVVFGPGDIAQAHTADEWISLDSLEQGKNLLLDFFRSLP